MLTHVERSSHMWKSPLFGGAGLAACRSVRPWRGLGALRAAWGVWGVRLALLTVPVLRCLPHPALSESWVDSLELAAPARVSLHALCSCVLTASMLGPASHHMQQVQPKHGKPAGCHSYITGLHVGVAVLHCPTHHSLIPAPTEDRQLQDSSRKAGPAEVLCSRLLPATHRVLWQTGFSVQAAGLKTADPPNPENPALQPAQ